MLFHIQGHRLARLLLLSKLLLLLVLFGPVRLAVPVAHDFEGPISGRHPYLFTYE